MSVVPLFNSDCSLFNCQEFSKELAKKEQSLLEMERKMELVQSKLEAYVAKEEAMVEKEVGHRRELQAVESRCMKLQSCCEKYQKQMDKLKGMYAQNERTLAAIRKERDVAESSVTALKDRLEKADIELMQYNGERLDPASNKNGAPGKPNPQIALSG